MPTIMFFLIALAVPFSLKIGRNCTLVSLLHHTLALILSVFGIIAVKVNVVES
jgi:hypothetical protein